VPDGIAAVTATILGSRAASLTRLSANTVVKAGALLLALTWVPVMTSNRFTP
jgi:hypothetical protein